MLYRIIQTPAILLSSICILLAGCTVSDKKPAVQQPALAHAFKRSSVAPFSAPNPDAAARSFEDIAALPDASFDVAEAWVALASEDGQPGRGTDRAVMLRAVDELALRAEDALPNKPDGVDCFDALYETVLNRKAAEGLSGDRAENYDPAFTLQKRKGTCLSMGLLALAVARRMKVPVYGVNAPSHFFLRYTDSENPRADITMDVTRPQPERWSKQDDSFYRRWQHIHREAEARGVYLRPLSDRESISVFLASRSGFHAREKNFPLAECDAERALQLYPENVVALINAGFANEGLGRYDVAEKHYRKAIELDPGAVRAMNNLAYLKIRDASSPAYDLRGAEETIDRALRLQPDRPYLHATRGEIRAARNDWRGATAALQQALKLDPKNAAYRIRFMELRSTLRGE